MPISELRGPHDVEVERDAAMDTRDGKTLLADVYRPVGVPRPLPTLVRRTPYGKHLNDLAEAFNEAHYFASHGYLVVVQNTRGRFGSEGAWYPFAYEAQDGFDAVEWAAAMPDSNGRVGMFGQSYGALSQYLTASQRPPHLVTAIPVSAYLAAFENYWYNRGALELNWTLSYFMNMATDALQAVGDDRRLATLSAMQVDPDLRFSSLTDDALRHLPLSDWIDRFGAGAPFLRDILHHTKDGPYWWATDLRRQLQNIDIPMLHVGSWYDIANWDTPQYFTGLTEHAMSETSRTDQALFMGPWPHLLPYNQPSRMVGELDCGPEAEFAMLPMQLAWFEHYVRRAAEGLPRARVTYFLMGADQWCDADTWPIPGQDIQALYLRGDGGSGIDNAGILSPRAPTDEAPHTYVYDPDDPVPTAGGRYVGGGVKDQRQRQARDDVLVFTAPPRETPLDLVGAVELELYASTDASDTDFVATLCEVRPDGYVQNLCEGLVRGRFRDSFDEPSLLEPGKVYRFTIPLGNIAHRVRAGHALNLAVTSSDFPRWDRNTNTGEDLAAATGPRRARQSVFHDSARASRLLLPVAPARTRPDS